METIEKRKWHTVDIKGRWKLTYTVGNTIGIDAFGGHHLPIYDSPFDMQTTYLRNVNRQALNGYLIDKPIKYFDPENNENERLLISWLICHPKVALKGIKDIDPIILAKKRTSKITLEALDLSELAEIEDEDYIDRIVGILSLEGGKQALSFEKIRWIMASLGLPYRDNRYEGASEKKALRKRLKNFTKHSIENAKKVDRAMKDLDDFKK